MTEKAANIQVDQRKMECFDLDLRATGAGQDRYTLSATKVSTFHG